MCKIPGQIFYFDAETVCEKCAYWHKAPGLEKFGTNDVTNLGLCALRSPDEMVKSGNLVCTPGDEECEFFSVRLGPPQQLNRETLQEVRSIAAGLGV